MRLRIKAPCCGVVAIGLLHSDDLSARATVTVPMPVICRGRRDYISEGFIPAGLRVKFWRCNVVAAVDNGICHKELGNSGDTRVALAG